MTEPAVQLNQEVLAVLREIVAINRIVVESLAYPVLVVTTSEEDRR